MFVEKLLLQSLRSEQIIVLANFQATVLEMKDQRHWRTHFDTMPPWLTSICSVLCSQSTWVFPMFHIMCVMFSGCNLGDNGKSLIESSLDTNTTLTRLAIGGIPLDGESNIMREKHLCICCNTKELNSWKNIRGWAVSNMQNHVTKEFSTDNWIVIKYVKNHLECRHEGVCIMYINRTMAGDQQGEARYLLLSINNITCWLPFNGTYRMGAGQHSGV